MAKRPDVGPKGAGLKASAPIFAALGDQRRLRLVTRLVAEGPLSIARLTAGTGVTRQAVSKHLHVLAGAGLVRGIRHGRERLWELEPHQLQEARRLLEVISRQWDEALARLKASVEGPPSSGARRALARPNSILEKPPLRRVSR